MSVRPLTNLRVQPSRIEDRDAIRDIVLRSDIFNTRDAECVEEMFIETWQRPREDNYRWLSCWQDQVLVGFACFGPESLTDATWDLFWICVRPPARGQGVGSALLSAATAQAADAGGRVMVIYTSSTPTYAPARRLYESQGFTHVATVPHYYRDNDHLCIYWKRLSSQSAIQSL